MKHQRLSPRLSQAVDVCGPSAPSRRGVRPICPLGRSGRLHAGRLLVATLLGLAAFSAWGRPARADISFVDLYRSGTFTQTGDGASLADGGYFFAARLYSTGAGDFDSADMTYPGPGSPAVLAPTDPTTLNFVSALYPTQGAMDADFPTGTYTFDAAGPGGSDSTSVEYLADDYPRSQPYLAGTDFTDLQGMDAGAPFTFHFSPFETGGQATESPIFFTIFDVAAGTLVFDAGFLPATTTGLTLSAGTLEPGRDYIYELIFSNRDLVPSPGAEFDAQLGFDLRTTGRFTTAVPEPASVVMLGIGGIGLMSRIRRGSRPAR